MIITEISCAFCSAGVRLVVVVREEKRRPARAVSEQADRLVHREQAGQLHSYGAIRPIASCGSPRSASCVSAFAHPSRVLRLFRPPLPIATAPFPGASV